MIIVVIGYILLSGMLTLVVPYWEINPTAALSEAFASKGVTWAKYVISIGALCGMTTTLFGSLFSLPRIIYAMASDGLLFSFLGRVNERTQLPIINLAVSGVLCSIIALLFDLAHLVEFMSIGTFLAYTIVSASVIILRYRPSNEIPEFIPSTKTHEGESSSDTSSTSSLTDSSPDDSQLIECQKVNPVGRLKKRYAKLSSFIGNWEPGTAVIAALILYIAGCCCISVLLLGLTSPFDHEPSWWNSLLYLFVSLIMVACLLVIGAHEQCPAIDDKFRVLFVPVVPAISIYINILLMSHLQILTWLRFLVWMFIGMS